MGLFNHEHCYQCGKEVSSDEFLHMCPGPPVPERKYSIDKSFLEAKIKDLQNELKSIKDYLGIEKVTETKWVKKNKGKK